MVKWGFSFEDIKKMPISEYLEYIDLIIKDHENEERAIKDAERGTGHGNREPKPIGQVSPPMKK